MVDPSDLTETLTHTKSICDSLRISEARGFYCHGVNHSYCRLTSRYRPRHRLPCNRYCSLRHMMFDSIIPNSYSVNFITTTRSNRVYRLSTMASDTTSELSTAPPTLELQVPSLWQRHSDFGSTINNAPEEQTPCSLPGYEGIDWQRLKATHCTTGAWPWC